jgi:phosphoadenosine phosphosulfate reductase
VTSTQSVLHDVQAAARSLEHAHPQSILAHALRTYSPHLAVSFSGAEDVVLIDLARQAGLPFRVFSLDTGRLHPETVRFIERVREHFDIEVELFSPQAAAVQRLTREKGLFSFYKDGHGECCSIRKVEPLGRALAGARAYVTGQRQDQSPATRGRLPVVEVDQARQAPDGAPLTKFNPLSFWSSSDVWRHIAERNLPYNELHDRGFRSIGCEPCTKATNPGQHEREGRWWWEEATKRECGLHLPSLGAVEA